ncbi:hypothetical protein B4U80_13679 [Leptotrombidium deliense]|uniref:Uncharacterized protein n=1 Tax=Leptotrombidium deliense TaxID=299467 RepID=A0A443SLT4_9ACAR|nr:hypothetical protein B4U80_13679 [Leptotrombidium deliense]
MTTIPKKKIFGCLKLFLSSAKHEKYSPNPLKFESLFMRVNYIPVDIELPKMNNSNTLLFVTGFIANDLFENTLSSIKVRVETKGNKNFNRSQAKMKISKNYETKYSSERESKQMGYDASLWLFNAKFTRNCIAELSYGNVFIVLRNEDNPTKRILVTLNDEYISYPGSYRNATIHLSTQVSELSFEKRCIEIDNLTKLVNRGIVLEMFTSGHSMQITPVTEVWYNEHRITIPTLQQLDPLFLRHKQNNLFQ